MLSFWRRVLCCDDELSNGHSNSEIHYEGSPFQSYNYPVIHNNYGTFLRNIPSVYNQPKQILPRINVKVFLGEDPEKTPDIPSSTDTNVNLKSTSSSSYLLLPHPPSPKLHPSSSSFGAFPGSRNSPSVSTEPILASDIQQSTSKRNQKRKIKLASDKKLKIAAAENCSLCKNSQKGTDYPRTSCKPPITLPSQDVKIDIDGSPGKSTVPPKRSLADYLHESGPRLVSLYGSTELYPTEEARCIIQGIVRAILNLKKDENKHNYLRHPENLVLGDKVCHTYSNYVRDLATEHVIRNRKILEQAGQDFPTSIEVTLEKNRMDLRCDDLAALEYLIFFVILVLDDDKKPLLSAEWRSFKQLFSNTKLDYAVLSSHPCLWGYTK